MTRAGEWRGGRLSRAMACRVARSDDSGATLIFALIFITAVAVMIAAVLSFVDTSMRTTVAVRRQTSAAAAADGAAQIAINSLRKSPYTDGVNCLNGSDHLDLPPSFYQPSGGTSYSATVTCDKDTPDSVTGNPGYPGGKPGNAILTLGTSNGDGITLDRGRFSGSFKVTATCTPTRTSTYPHR